MRNDRVYYWRDDSDPSGQSDNPRRLEDRRSVLSLASVGSSTQSGLCDTRDRDDAYETSRQLSSHPSSQMSVRSAAVTRKRDDFYPRQAYLTSAGSSSSASTGSSFRSGSQISSLPSSRTSVRSDAVARDLEDVRKAPRQAYPASTASFDRDQDYDVVRNAPKQAYPASTGSSVRSDRRDAGDLQLSPASVGSSVRSDCCDDQDRDKGNRSALDASSVSNSLSRSSSQSASFVGMLADVSSADIPKPSRQTCGLCHTELPSRHQLFLHLRTRRRNGLSSRQIRSRWREMDSYAAPGEDESRLREMDFKPP